jgi:hypothetical protein
MASCNLAADLLHRQNAILHAIIRHFCPRPMRVAA